MESVTVRNKTTETWFSDR